MLCKHKYGKRDIYVNEEEIVCFCYNCKLQTIYDFPPITKISNNVPTCNIHGTEMIHDLFEWICPFCEVEAQIDEKVENE